MVEKKEEVRGERWHVGKEMPIVVLVGFVIQILFTGIWIGRLESKVDYGADLNRELKNEVKELSYQVAALTFEKKERERDNAIINQKFQVLENEIMSLKRKYR